MTIEVRGSVVDRSSRRCWLSRLALSASTGTVCYVLGCANPGPPKPPSLHLPALVSDLVAERVGDTVQLTWTTPARTTDELNIKGTMTAEVCREVGPRPLTPLGRSSACAPARRLAVAPGPSQLSDELPAQLVSGPDQLLTYRIQIQNATGHSAGQSVVAAYAAAGASTAPVESLTATSSATGAVLHWKNATASDGLQIDLTRVDLTPKLPAEKGQKPVAASPVFHRKRPVRTGKPAEGQPNVVHLRTSEPSSRGGVPGTLDTSALIGSMYTYTAAQVRTVTLGSRRLDIYSKPSATVTIALRDTFPPRAPSGLATVSGAQAAAGTGAPSTPYIDLSWEPNAESDLGGYVVYRQTAQANGDAQGAPERLTQQPITVPAYRDVAVTPGRRYIYSVTAVDASGNESAPSAKAQDTVDLDDSVAAPGIDPPH